jgi:hypothetical protein
MEGLLAEAEAKIAKLDKELISKSERFEQENQKFDTKFEAEVEKSSNLQKSLKELQDKCLEFSYRCVQRLKQVFNSVGACSEKFSPSVEDLPGTFEHIEGEIDALDEVIAGHGDFCALLASRGTAIAFMKSGCTHGKIVNRPNCRRFETGGSLSRRVSVLRAPAQMGRARGRARRWERRGGRSRA